MVIDFAANSGVLLTQTCDLCSQTSKIENFTEHSEEFPWDGKDTNPVLNSGGSAIQTLAATVNHLKAKSHSNKRQMK